MGLECMFCMDFKGLSMGKPGDDVLVSLESSILQDLVQLEREFELQCNSSTNTDRHEFQW